MLFESWVRTAAVVWLVIWMGYRFGIEEEVNLRFHTVFSCVAWYRWNRLIGEIDGLVHERGVKDHFVTIQVCETRFALPHVI